MLQRRRLRPNNYVATNPDNQSYHSSSSFLVCNSTNPDNQSYHSSSSFLVCNSKLRLPSAIRREHPQQRAVLSHTYCFGERKVVVILTVLSHVMRGRPGRLLQSARVDTNRIFLASALSTMRAMCPNRVIRHDWIVAVSLGCFVILHASSVTLYIVYHQGNVNLKVKNDSSPVSDRCHGSSADR